jgi:CRISPR/Cas system-associated exonuclease Cas4 (RecB family)
MRELFGPYELAEARNQDNTINYQLSISKTKELISQGVNVIAEATFSKDNLFCMVDLLVKNGDNYDIYEVKSSDGFTEKHLIDGSFQYYVLSKVLNVGKVYIVYVNDQYVNPGKVDLEKLTKKLEMTDYAISETSKIEKAIEAANNVVKSLIEPKAKYKEACNDCGFLKYCHEPLLENNSVLKLYRQRQTYKEELVENGIDKVDELFKLVEVDKYNKNQESIFSEEEILTLYKHSGIDQDHVAIVSNLVDDNFNFNVINEHQVSELIFKDFIYDDIEELNKFFSDVKYPLHFIDFEYFSHPYPYFFGTKPNERIPFQYSLHIIDSPGAEVRHVEYLKESFESPFAEVAKSLLENISLNGTIFVYNKGADGSILKDLATKFPEYKDSFKKMHSNIKDLLVIFKKGWSYRKGLYGDMSLKSVLPTYFANDLELSYKAINVQNGTSAVEFWKNIDSSNNKEEQIKNLKEYCRIDTLGLVKLYKYFKEQLIIANMGVN